MKILINTPDLSKHGGGVTNHYLGLFPYWKSKVKYNPVGKRKNIPGPLFLIYDYIKFIFLCAFGKYDVILLNPSLGKNAVNRDAVFLKISKWFKIKTIVFFHGWMQNLADEIEQKPNNFINKYQKADGFIVLASNFKNQLQNWGISKPIYLSTTKVNDELIKDFKIENKKFNYKLLFLARIEENKGIFIALNTLKLLSLKYPKLKLIVAGDGSALQKAKDFAKEKEIRNVEFLGNIKGNNLINTFSKSDIYILPTTHGEGMPTSILEAMAFGLPIISRPVGGMVDFFEEDKMGYLLDSITPEVYGEKIIELLDNQDKCKIIGSYNHNYAKEHFMASKVSGKIEKILSL